MIKKMLLVMLLLPMLAATAQRTTNDGNEGGVNAANGSGVQEIWLHDNKVKELTNLCMVWGFVKYYHADVQRGKYDMDAALFKVLPDVLSAANTDSANAVMERWVDGFGKPGKCGKCEPYVKSSETKLEPDYGYIFKDNNLPASLKEKLTYLLQNRYEGKNHQYVSKDKYAGNPVFEHENEYATTTLPDAGVRLLALFRYWNMIQYFYPYRHLIGEDWNRALEQMIPEFCNARDVLSYQKACLRMIVRINDSHAGLNTAALSAEKGKYMTPFAAGFIEDRLVVTDYYIDTLGIKGLVKPGDIIEMIDGVSVLDLIRKYLPLTNGSNFERKLYTMAGGNGFLLRSDDPTTRLAISRDGKTLEVAVPKMAINDSNMERFRGSWSAVGHKLLDGNIGYLYPAKLKDEELEVIKDKYGGTKGLIIDFRCYPNLFMTFSYGNWLKSENGPFALYTTGSTDIPGLFVVNDPMKNGNKKGDHYNGKVIILVDASTQSSAEYQTMALQSAPNTMVVGSQTSGADGNVSWITLPGGLKTAISGIGILYPDGTETQRVGIKIDKVLQRTINGVSAGKDEVLEAAIQMLNK
jgi:hypothetical protein